jgi:hypothetical protein
MSGALTLADLERMREELDLKSVPTEHRMIRMHEGTFTQWCEVFKLSQCEVRHNKLDNGIIEVYA